MVRMKKENILARKLKFSPVDNSGAVWAFYQRIIYTKATLPFKLKSEPIADHVKSGFFWWLAAIMVKIGRFPL